jgi:RNA polymerase sigma factor (sigma-70 family)
MSRDEDRPDHTPAVPAMVPGTAFPPTLWTLVSGAGAGSPAALDQLCRLYWKPIREYLRRFRLAHEDAEDLTQGFLLHLMSAGRLARPQRTLGRFRSYLLAALRHYVCDHLRRTGAVVMVPLEGDPEAGTRLAKPPLSRLPPPDVAYERGCALALIGQAFLQVQAEYVDRGQADRFEVLQHFLPGKDPDLSQAEAGARLGLTEGAVAKAVFDLRARLRDAYRSLVAQTVASPADVDDEISHHLSVLRRSE